MKIRAESLVKAYRGRRVVDGVSFSLDQGEVVGLLGPNGAGKTTTFYMVTGLVRPNGGRVFFDDRDVTGWPMFKRARAGVGYLPQESSVFRRNRLAEELHFADKLDRPGGVLSGGERRRVEIARALATEPKFILLDEPFTGIDPKTISELQGIVRRLARSGIGVLITDHNVDATLRITDRNYILIDGKIVSQGSADDVRADEDVRRHYLGQEFTEDEDAE
jgi:lipopolysaccharide export system ATP-binding protein